VNKTLKRIVLVSLFALFFVIGGISVFYAQGYRFDTDSLTVKKVGAIYIKTLPGEAQVTLDGKVIDKSYWLFNSGKLIQSLFPKNYELIVSNPTFKTAKFNILVSPSLVSELSHVVLIPEKPENSIKEVYQAEGQLSEIFPLTKKTDQTLYLAGSKIGKYEPLAISNDGSAMLASGKSSLYYIKKDGKGKIEISTTTITLYPKNATYRLNERNEGILSFTDHEIYSLQNKNKPVRLYASTSTITIPTINEEKIAWVEESNSSTQKLAIYNQGSGKTNNYQIATEAKIAELKWQPDGKLLIVDSSENLYVYSEGDANLNKLTTKAKFISVSPDSKKIAVAGSDRLEIFMTNGKYFRANISSIGYPEKIIGLKDSGHLLFKAINNAYLVDIDSPIPENFQKISEADALWYDIGEDSIYILLNAVLNLYKLPS
jgi:hypothetical protein